MKNLYDIIQEKLLISKNTKRQTSTNIYINSSCKSVFDTSEIEEIIKFAETLEIQPDDLRNCTMSNINTQTAINLYWIPKNIYSGTHKWNLIHFIKYGTTNEYYSKIVDKKHEKPFITNYWKSLNKVFEEVIDIINKIHFFDIIEQYRE